jgi:hypothetical protein
METLKKISTEDLRQLTASLNEFVAEFGAEGDRARVILAAAKLDLQLYHLLVRVLRTSPQQSDSLIDGNGPLSSFSSRIDISHRLGMISAELARALHLVRRIRNDFAHEVAGASLTAGAHRDRVVELCRPLLEFKEFDMNRKKFENHPEGPSRDCRAMLAILVARLSGALHRLDPLDCSSEVPLVPPGWTRVTPE